MLSLIVAGCASYTPNPIKPSDTAAVLDARSLDDPRLQTFLAAALPQDSHASAGSLWDLPKLTLAALYYHPDITLAQAKLATAEAGVESASAIPNPTLSFGISYDTSSPTELARTPWTIGPSIDFLIETFGKRDARTQQAERLADAARADLATAAWQVRGRLRSAMLLLWAEEQRRSLSDRRRDREAELVGMLERRLAVGQAATPEVTRERINRDQYLIAAQDAERQAAEARVQLATAIGVPAHALDGIQTSFGDLDRAGLPRDFSNPTLRRQALLDRSDIKGLLSEYAAAEAAVRLEVARQYPDITIGPGYTYDTGDNKFGINLQTSLPIFNQNQGPIAEAEGRRKQAAARFLALQAQIISDLDRAWTGYRQSTQELATADQLLVGQEQRERQIERAFAVGAADRLAFVGVQLETTAIALARLDVVVRQRQALGQLEDASQQPLFVSSLIQPAPSALPQQISEAAR